MLNTLGARNMQETANKKRGRNNNKPPREKGEDRQDIKREGVRH